MDRGGKVGAGGIGTEVAWWEQVGYGERWHGGSRWDSDRGGMVGAGGDRSGMVGAGGIVTKVAWWEQVG